MTSSMLLARSHQKGFSLVEGLVALGLLSAILGVAGTVGTLLNDTNNIDSRKAAFQTISSSLMSTVTYQTAWDVTKTKNASMNCAKTFPSSCTNGTQAIVAVYNSEGKKLTDPSNENQGFKTDGDVCYTFKTGENGCLYRAEVGWYIKCSSPESCQYPEEQISVTFKYSGKEKFNVQAFNFPPQARANLAANQSPTTSCAKNSGVFVGYGQTVYDGDGGVYASNTRGCVPLTAFRGSTGPQGPQGPQGPRGPTGSMGGPGSVYYLPPPVILSGGPSDPGPAAPPVAAAPPPPPVAVAPSAPPPPPPPPDATPIFVASATPPPSCPDRGVWPNCFDYGSPLMIAYNSDVNNPEPLVFTSLAEGIMFDLLGLNAKPKPHTPVRISWYRSPQYYFLVLPDENGRVHGIDQLFGDNTHGPDGKFAANGYKALAKYDGMSADGKTRVKEADGYITPEDPIYSKLRLWQDSNFDGIAQEGELLSLKQMDIQVIDLNADPNFKEEDQYGNLTTLKSVVKTGDGRYHLMFDIWFAYRSNKMPGAKE